MKLYVSFEEETAISQRGKTLPCSRFWKKKKVLFRVFQGSKIKELFTIVSLPNENEIYMIVAQSI